MAEIFGAVASGAGLMSLAVQLLESSQKLKSFYNASRDAPQTIADLSFELETMSLSLRQLVIHRQADISNDTLLVRCMTTCTLMTTKIEDAVKKMEHLLRKSRGIGRMYSAFKEPEILKLLEGLEHAKSSMLFAYMGYCQSWNLRQAALRAAEAQSQNALLSAHEAQLQNLSFVVQSGHASILERIDATRSLGSNISAPCASTVNSNRQGILPRGRTINISAQTLRLALPRWLAHRVWEFAVHDIDGAWNFRVRPINIRPYGTFAFDILRSGNVEAVRKLLASGELSVSDHENDLFESRHKSLLFIAAESGHLQLCEFLLHEFLIFRSDTELHESLNGFVRQRTIFYRPAYSKEIFGKLTEAFYTLFLRKYGMLVDLKEMIDKPVLEFDRDHWLPPGHLDDIGSNTLLTDETLREVIMSQTIPFNMWHPIDRFCAAVNARGWPAGAFIKLVDTTSDAQLAQWTDRRGKTALHWAAEHFGWCMSRSFGSESSRYIARRGYGELCMMLIANGANQNALDSKKRTPFACLLRALQTKMDSWFDSDLCDAVAQWGQCIQDAGVSLYAYVLAENRAQSRHGSAASNLRIRCKEHPWACRLIILKASTLAIEVGFSVPRHLWQYNPPPGSWRNEDHRLEKIGWIPYSYFEGDDCILWQQVESRRINLPPLPVCPYQVSSLGESISRAWEEWFTGVQDDHGFVCMTLPRPPSVTRERGRTRRAASLPPPTTVPDRFPQVPNEQRIIYQFAGGRWISEPHRCPLDLKWKSAYCSTNDIWASRRRCMLGRCDDGEPDLLDSRHWEVDLLDDESNIEIARRFTDRFRPEWRSIVEENHIRRQRRAELGMSTT